MIGVKDEIKVCKNDEEISKLNQRLDELLQQAGLSGIDLNEV
jgi:hypothetical protein